MKTIHSIVISCFAIIILSVIGALFKANHHTMVGDTNDPEDGAAVAGTVFSAVLVYAVCFLSQRFDTAYRWRIGGGEKERNRSGGMALRG